MSEHDRGEDAPSEDSHKKNSPGENAAGEVGFARGLTNYGDRGFSCLRRSFARSMGYSTEMLAKPIVGIANTGDSTTPAISLRCLRP